MITSCEKDSFTDPNDPRFGTVGDEIILNVSNTFQTVDHFGASGGFAAQWVGQWPDASKEPIAKLFFSTEMDAQGNPEGIGLSMWRVNIGDGAREQLTSGFAPNAWFRETECFLDEDGITYDWTKQSGSQWFVSKASEYGVPGFTAWITTPPYFMSKNGYTFRTAGVDGFNCQESKYGEYASFLAQVMKHYEDQGYNFEVVCPFNETQYEWAFEVGEASQSGTKAFNSQVAEVTRIIDQEFTDQGVNAKIMIPETAQLRYLYEGSSNTENQLSEFFNPSSANYIGDLDNLSTHIAAHSYFSNSTPEQSITQRQTLRTALASFPDLDYWQTEYSLLGTAYQQGKDMSELTEMDYSLWLARIIHTDLVHGNATGWSFWTALNLSTFQDHPFRFNLILYEPNASNESHTDGTFKVGKNLWAFGNYSRFVRPGMVRFEVLDPAYGEEAAVENFMISGYKSASGNDIVIVCVNNTDQNRQLALGNYGTDFEVVDGTFDVYTTSESEDLSKSTANFDELVIPGKSIVTLTAQLN
ncbi:glycoside hydrolase [Fulvivirga sp. M361]|uniref:glycoside hydrolase n=1 Tax=Fulvivirga sp. M361 TaxID=2594266 RepID=UPI001623996B|nr:glycoside hydrolase [Fulvivirga sp. M361]